MRVGQRPLLLHNRHELLQIGLQAADDQLDVVVLERAVAYSGPQEGLDHDVLSLRAMCGVERRAVGGWQ